MYRFSRPYKAILSHLDFGSFTLQNIVQVRVSLHYAQTMYIRQTHAHTYNKTLYLLRQVDDFAIPCNDQDTEMSCGIKWINV